jgi:hypothetical protein
MVNVAKSRWSLIGVQTATLTEAFVPKPHSLFPFSKSLEINRLIAERDVLFRRTEIIRRFRDQFFES